MAMPVCLNVLNAMNLLKQIGFQSVRCMYIVRGVERRWIELYKSKIHSEATQALENGMKNYKKR